MAFSVTAFSLQERSILFLSVYSIVYFCLFAILFNLFFLCESNKNREIQEQNYELKSIELEKWLPVAAFEKPK